MAVGYAIGSSEDLLARWAFKVTRKLRELRDVDELAYEQQIALVEFLTYEKLQFFEKFYKHKRSGDLAEAKDVLTPTLGKDKDFLLNWIAEKETALYVKLAPEFRSRAYIYFNLLLKHEYYLNFGSSLARDMRKQGWVKGEYDSQAFALLAQGMRVVLPIAVEYLLLGPEIMQYTLLMEVVGWVMNLGWLDGCQKLGMDALAAVGLKPTTEWVLGLLGHLAWQSGKFGLSGEGLSVWGFGYAAATACKGAVSWGLDSLGAWWYGDAKKSAPATLQLARRFLESMAFSKGYRFGAGFAKQSLSFFYPAQDSATSLSLKEAYELLAIGPEDGRDAVKPAWQAEIRKVTRLFRGGEMDAEEYNEAMRKANEARDALNDLYGMGKPNVKFAL